MAFRRLSFFVLLSILLGACTGADSAAPATDGGGETGQVVTTSDAGEITSIQPPTTPTTSLPTTTLPPVEPPEGYQLVFREEFNGATLDTRVWNVDNSTFGEGNNELHCYSPENVELGEGSLLLTGTDQQTTCPGDKQREYGSGMITTRDTAAFRYAWFEVRARVPEGQGLWPAIWLSPNEDAYGSWPRSGEIDLMELRGQNPDIARVNYHYADALGDRAQSPVDVVAVGPAFNEAFHTFGLRWTETDLTWFVDGSEVHSVSGWTSNVGPSPAPFDQRFFLRLNLAIGGNFPGSPDGSTPWPATMEVDYVRVFQQFP